jgi:hypothetical protein
MLNLPKPGVPGSPRDSDKGACVGKSLWDKRGAVSGIAGAAGRCIVAPALAALAGFTNGMNRLEQRARAARAETAG